MGNVSGGALNPAVALGLAVGSGLGPALLYSVAQLLAGALASVAFKATHGTVAETKAIEAA